MTNPLMHRSSNGMTALKPLILNVKVLAGFYLVLSQDAVATGDPRGDGFTDEMMTILDKVSSAPCSPPLFLKRKRAADFFLGKKGVFSHPMFFVGWNHPVIILCIRTRLTAMGWPEHLKIHRRLWPTTHTPCSPSL